ncbi:MAG TPA: 3-hydroxyacyl-CoA dehydrogenase NAD-binding domain-containing protein [Bryobacteraceae bacterium]|nr:3-hydroxyacyl-CoA dehydrogenase NAD-binding domain-containing protein [Bryobacteraceae bacterium]
MMSNAVTWKRDLDVLVVTIDNPPVNALSPGVLEGIVEGVEAGVADEEVRAVVVIGAGKTFIAGADIREFPKIMAGERPMLSLNPLLERIENAAKPVVMALHGTALGGGLETAMAGHYRVAASSTQLGQPEVKLGLIPGAGGTQRLPRLVGVERALELCVFGNPVTAKEAVDWGLVDALVDGDLLAGAVAYARTLQAPRRTRDLTIESAPEEAIEMIREEARRRMRGQAAPLSALEVVCAADIFDFDEGLAFEARIFESLLKGPQAKAMIHVFFGEREVVKLPFVPKETRPREIRRAAIVGAGTMGRGIALCFANAGVPVQITDAAPAALGAALDWVKHHYEHAVKHKRLPAEEAARRAGRITGARALTEFGEADLIIEAVSEDPEVKRGVFAEMDRVARPGCLLASNTSTLDIDALAGATGRPGDVLGLHFFSPASVMRLLEVVRGAETSPEVIATAMELARRLRKVAVVAGNKFGFIGNRMFAPYREAAIRCVQEGALPWVVDQAIENYGLAMGPLAVGDLAGLDIGRAIRKEAGMPETVEDALCETGRLGQKNGRGWYHWEGNRRSADPGVEQVVRAWSEKQGIAQRTFTAREIVDRCLGALRAEGRKVLEEGVALRAVDIDIVYVHGYGYPAWRGGPMFDG